MRIISLFLDENDNWNDQEPQMMHRSNKSGEITIIFIF